MFNKRFIPLISTALLLFSCGGNTDGTLKMNKMHTIIIPDGSFPLYATNAISLKANKEVTVKFDCQPFFSFSGSSHNLTIAVLKEIQEAVPKVETLLNSTTAVFDEILDFKINGNSMIGKEDSEWDPDEEYTYCYTHNEGEDQPGAIYATAKETDKTMKGSLSFTTHKNYEKMYIVCWGFTKF